jgi:UDP-3-O-[3-hydroxymyristoyl] glucosamine N-acyltransferase
MYSLGEIAQKIGATCEGDAQLMIDGIADLTQATSSQLSFVTRQDYASHLADSNAGAIIISSKLKPENSSKNFLLMDNPYLGYALCAQLFDNTPKVSEGIHPSAVIAEDVKLGEGVSIGANSTIESGVVLADNVAIGANCFIGKNSSIGEATSLFANVTVYHGVVIGKRAIIHSGSIIGSDGFGFANDSANQSGQGPWVKIPQIGGVVIGDDFEAGSNCTIDRGALNDTQIGNGVKLDNLVHIAHNVKIGDGTAMAATTGIAGGTVIGKGCTFAGRVSVIGHLTICDNAHLTVGSTLTKSIDKPGVYSSGDAAQPSRDWKRQIARMRKLDDMMHRIKALEKKQHD